MGILPRDREIGMIAKLSRKQVLARDREIGVVTTLGLVPISPTDPAAQDGSGCMADTRPTA
jgi:hypothetical protein